jgi:hypothetical protein
LYNDNEGDWSDVTGNADVIMGAGITVIHIPMSCISLDGLLFIGLLIIAAHQYASSFSIEERMWMRRMR